MKGENVKGENAKGDNMKVENARGENVRGEKGRNAKGENELFKIFNLLFAKGENAKGENVKGDNLKKGMKVKGENVKGKNTKAEKAKAWICGLCKDIGIDGYLFEKLSEMPHLSKNHINAVEDGSKEIGQLIVRLNDAFHQKRSQLSEEQQLFYWDECFTDADEDQSEDYREVEDIQGK